MSVTIRLTVALLLLVIVAGCENPPANNPVKEYGDTMIEKMQESRETAGEASLASARRTIAFIRSSEGRYPLGLDEISSSMGEALSPDVYAYDPATGEISLR